MKKKIFLLATCIGLGAMSVVSAQEASSSSRSLIRDGVDYGQQNETYNDYEINWKKNEFKDNWTISLGGGAQVYYGEDDNKGDFKNRITFAPQFSLTKYFGPTWGFRLNVTGGSLHGYNDGLSGIYRKWNHGSKNYLGEGYVGPNGFPNGKQNTAMLTYDPQWIHNGAAERGEVRLNTTNNTYEWVPGLNGGLYLQRMRYIQVNLDFTFDLFNAIGGYDSRRFFEVAPYGGVGLYNAFSYYGNDNFIAAGLHAGFQFKFRISDRFGIYADLGGSLVPDDFDGQSGDHTSMNGIAQATAGISYKIGKTDWEVIQPVDYDLINSLNGEINRLRNELNSKPAIVEILPTPPVQPYEKPADQTKFLPDPVFFRLNSSAIDNNQWDAIDKAANYLNKYPDTRVVLTGYADKETGSPSYNMKLSEKRSKAVAEVLTQRYNINPIRISVNWSGSQIQPFEIQDWNRVVIFVIE